MTTKAATTTEATARPLIVKRDYDGRGLEQFELYREPFLVGIIETEADALLIARAVNSFDALVDAAKEAIDLLDADVDNALDAIIVLRTALAQADGGRERCSYCGNTQSECVGWNACDFNGGDNGQ